jgi:hypothetical protein
MTMARRRRRRRQRRRAVAAVGKKAKNALAGLRPGDKKLVKSFIKSVDSNLWGVGSEDREKALKELEEHIIEKSGRWNVENAIEVSILSMGSPESLAKGIRTLYGYGTGFKVFLLTFVIMLSIPTVLQVNPLLNVMAIMALVVLFYILSHFGTKTGLAFGAGMGLAAALTRSLTVLAIVSAMPTDYNIGTQQAIIDFTLICIFLVIVGMLAGHIHDSSVKKYFAQ